MYTSGRLATDEVIRAQRELLLAIRGAIRTADDLSRDQAEGVLSGIFSSLWNDSELMLKELMHREPRG